MSHKKKKNNQMQKPDLSQFKKHQKFGKRASNLVLNTSIISATATPFIGIPLVIGKEYLFQGARKNKEIIKFLKSQIRNNKKTQNIKITLKGQNGNNNRKWVLCNSASK